MIVAVQIEDDDPPMAGDQPLQQQPQMSVEIVVGPERAADHFRGGVHFHTSSPQASAGVMYTAFSRGRLRSTSNRERRATMRVGAIDVHSPVYGSSS